MHPLRRLAKRLQALQRRAGGRVTRVRLRQGDLEALASLAALAAEGAEAAAEERSMRLGDVMRLLGVSSRQVNNLVRVGSLPVRGLTPGGQRRFWRIDVQRQPPLAGVN